MRNVALVLGAGASLAEAQSYRPMQTSEHPPVDSNFFSKVAELGDKSLRQKLTRFAQQAGLQDPFGPTEPRMEEFFGDIYFELAGAGDEVNSALDAYRTLLRLYTRVLAQTTNWFHNRPRGPLGTLIRVLLQQPGLEALTLITFNHDLVLENTLSMLPFKPRWCVDEGYGPIRLIHKSSARGGLQLARHSNACNHSVKIQILKLHGSLNWQVPTKSHDPAMRDLFPSPDDRVTLECFLNREVSVRLQRTKGKRKWRLWPQIVPPIYQKADIVQARFGPLWRAASEALQTADEVALVGYSLPSTDVHAEKLVKHALGKNTGLEHLDVVNPDATLTARVEPIPNLKAISWHRSIVAYTNHWKDNPDAG